MWIKREKVSSISYNRVMCLSSPYTVAKINGIPKFGKLKGTHTPWGAGKVFEKGKEILPLTVMLPSIHKILIPLYAILGIFGVVLVADLPHVWTTSSGLYLFIGDLGPFLTVVVAIVYLYTIFKKMQK